MYKGDDVPVVLEDTSIKDTIYAISSKRLGATAVVNERKILSGIITDGDLRRLLEKTLDIKELVARDVMTKNPKTIREKYLASFALQLMENHNITSVIVVDDNKGQQSEKDRSYLFNSDVWREIHCKKFIQCKSGSDKNKREENAF